MAQPMIKNILLDWSGTVADDLPNVLQAVNGMLRTQGQAEMTRSEFQARFHLPYTSFFHEVLPELSLEELQQLYLQHFPHVHEGVELLPHVADFLRYASASGRRLVVLSSAPVQHVEAQATHLGVRDFFEVLRCGVIDKRQEIHALLLQLDMRPEETIFIGDMRHDIDAAHAAGVLSIATCTGYESAATLLTAQPHFLVPDLSHLPRLLGQAAAGRQDGAPPISTVGALILDTAGHLLLIRTHKWSHKWGIPGGKIKRGETCAEALEREILEETALRLREVQFVMVQDCIEPPEFQRSAHFLLLNYLAHTSAPEPQPPVLLNEEAQTYQWLPPSAALEQDLNIPTRVLIEECLRQGLLPQP